MSFRLKAVLLILSIALIPYISIMFYIGNMLRDTYNQNITKEMQTQLSLTTKSIEQYIQTLQNDMQFMVRLDVMNDIFSGDLDRRISKLLEEKKDELKLYGDFYIIDKNNNIIASSDTSKLGKKITFKPFFTYPVHSTFDNSVIADLVLEFSPKNLTYFFNNTKDRIYYILLDNEQPLFKEKTFKQAFVVKGFIKDTPNIEIVLEQDKELFLELLHKSEYWFFVTIFLGAFIITIIALFLINRLIKPIISLSQIADEITQKQDYSYRVDSSSNDEVGKLSKSFNKMLIGMSDTLNKLKEETKNREILIQEQGKNEMLKQLSHKLSKYLSPQIYESIFSGAQDVTLTSKRKKLTIFFSDIVNFTDTTETMESEDLSELLNDYLNDMTQIALKYGATVDKYIGDAIMLFFGDPKSNGIEEDATACVHMALKMQEHMHTLHQRWNKKGFTKPFMIRIGIHTGYCTVGNFGSENRLEYTIIGSSVNLASRIESSANPNEILISEETQLLVDGKFTCKRSKEITPKGFTRPISLYSVFNKTDKEEDEISIQEDGLDLRLQMGKISHKDKELLKEKLVNIINRLS
ncbi:HAMP domain-containing protein [bacterium]|nr:HAMP domain-containing protein [bacterium]MBU1883441.1 HAMP domain-containing protein [bacterium]